MDLLTSSGVDCTLEVEDKMRIYILGCFRHLWYLTKCFVFLVHEIMVALAYLVLWYV